MTEPVFDIRIDGLFYGPHRVVRDTRLAVAGRSVTALIGPSGCGKSSVLRCLNRMNDLVAGFRLDGRVTYRGRDLYAADVDPVAVRRVVGMVFQKAHVFPCSIAENAAFGLKLIGDRSDRAAKIETALRAADLWDEVKDKLAAPGLSLSGGQQQRLCIARAVATGPDVLLLDEPCSALDPVSTGKIEDLMHALKRDYCVILVTHNLQQAKRVADTTAFFSTDLSGADRTGYLVESGPTADLFAHPQNLLTAAYLSGKFG